jgi:hypothetical protein
MSLEYAQHLEPKRDAINQFNFALHGQTLIQLYRNQASPISCWTLKMNQSFNFHFLDPFN